MYAASDIPDSTRRIGDGLYKNFIYDEERKFIFAYVPKVACTNWKSIFRKLNGAEDWLNSTLAHDRDKGGLTYLEPELDAPNAGLPEGVPRYAMVRDPYERALSAYLNKIEHLAGKPPSKRFDHWNRIIDEIDAFRREALGADQYPQINFEVFLRWLKESGSWSARDEHWAPQSDLLCQPHVAFDYIGRFEAIEKDSAHILDLIGENVRLPSQKQVKFAPTNAKAFLETYLTPQARDLVEDIYAVDFINFKYKSRSGRNLASYANQSHLKKSLIVNKGTGFISVASPFESEIFVRKNFSSAASSSPGVFASHIAKNSRLPRLMTKLADLNGGEPVKVFDLGAFMGAFAAAAKHAADAAGVETEVLCVEPNPRVQDALSANLAIHGVTAGVMQAAVGLQNGKARLSFHETRMIGARVLNPNQTPPPDHVVADVDVLGLVDLLALEKSVGLVKMDIAGLELAALRSLMDSPSRLNNVFLVRLRPWQLDKQFDDGLSFLDWLLARFVIVPVKNPTLPANEPMAEPFGPGQTVGQDGAYVIAIPKAHESVFEDLAEATAAG